MKFDNDQKSTGQVEHSTSNQTTKIMNTILHNKVNPSGLLGVINFEPTKQEVIENQTQSSFTIDKLMAEIYDMKGIYNVFISKLIKLNILNISFKLIKCD